MAAEMQKAEFCSHSFLINMSLTTLTAGKFPEMQNAWLVLFDFVSFL